MRFTHSILFYLFLFLQAKTFAQSVLPPSPEPKVLKMAQALCQSKEAAKQANGRTARFVMTERTSSEIKALCPLCDLKVIKDILTVREDPNNSSAKSTPVLGTRAEWKSVELENADNLQRSFSNTPCITAIAEFKKETYRLGFISVFHEGMFSDQEKNEQRAHIKSQIEKQQPKTLIVEGYSGALSCEESFRIYLTPDENLLSEAEYAVKLALAKNIPVIGGEPAGSNFTQKDHRGFEILQFLSQHSGSGSSLKEAYQRIPPQLDWPLDEFKKWYASKNGREFQIENASLDLNPSFYMSLQNLKPRGTNKMADDWNLFRDQNIATLAYDQLMAKKNAMIVYGKDHFPAQLKVYEKAFGKHDAPVAKCKLVMRSPSQPTQKPKALQ